MHDERRYRYFFQVRREIRLREGDDAIVMRLRTPHHSLAPPVLDDSSRNHYRSPGVAFSPAIAIALIYAGRASMRLTYETTFGRSSIARPPNRGNEVSGNITI